LYHLIAFPLNDLGCRLLYRLIAFRWADNFWRLLPLGLFKTSLFRLILLDFFPVCFVVLFLSPLFSLIVIEIAALRGAFTVQEIYALLSFEVQSFF